MKSYFFLIILSISLIGLVSSAETFGYGRTENIPINYSNIVINETSNQSEYWNTNLGSLDNANSTHFENIGGALTINSSWIDSVNFWQRVGTTLSPITAGDDITTTGMGIFDEVQIKGDGATIGILGVYDEDEAEYTYFATSGGRGYLKTAGTSPGRLLIQDSAHAGVTFFEGASDGENPTIKQSGYITNGANEVDIIWTVKDTDDYFWLERENTNILGFKIDMPLDLVDNNITTTGKGTFGSTTDGIVLNDGASTFHVYGSDTTEYGKVDTGIDFISVTKATPPSLALIETAGNVDAGLHYYFVTYTTAFGETETSGTTASITTDATHKQVTVTIPVSPDYRVTGRKIYRTKAGGANYQEYLLATITNNIDTEYIDNIADATIDAGGRVYLYTRPNTATNLLLKDGVNAMVVSNKATSMGEGVGISGNGVVYGQYAGANLQSVALGNHLFGHYSGNSITTGTGNSAFGFNTLNIGAGTGTLSTAMGYYALAVGSGTTGNTGIGGRSGLYVTGNYNTFLGYYSGYSVSGSGAITYNTALGSFAGQSLRSSATRNIFLGSSAGSRQTTASNLLIVDNQQRADVGTEATNAILYGVMAATPANQTLRVNADVFLNDDNRKLALGAAGANDSYIQFGGTNLEYYSSGAHDFGAGNIITTGKGTFGSTYQATVGDDGNARAGYFYDGTRYTYLADGSRALWSSDGTRNAYLADGTNAGYFTDGSSNYVEILDGTYGVEAYHSSSGNYGYLADNSYGVQGYRGSSGTSAGYFYDGTRSVELADGSHAGYFSDGTRYAYLADGSHAGYFSDGTRYAYLADGSQAGYFYDGTRSVDIADGTHILEGNIGSGGNYGIYLYDSSSNYITLMDGNNNIANFYKSGYGNVLLHDSSGNSLYSSKDASGSTAGYFYDGSRYAQFADGSYAGYFSGDVYITGTLTTSGGSDPPYLLWFNETRDSVSELTKRNIPSGREQGIIQFYNQDTNTIEFMKPATCEFFKLDKGSLVLLEDRDGVCYNDNTITEYYFNPNTGEAEPMEVIKRESEFELLKDVVLDKKSGNFYNATTKEIISKENAVKRKEKGEQQILQ